MSNYILKSGTNLLKSGNAILTSSGSAPTPVLYINFENLIGLYTDGQKVPQFTDVTGKIFFTQSNPDNQATFVANAANGKPALRFSGGQFYDATVAITCRTIFCYTKATIQNQPYGTLFSGSAGAYGFFLGSSNTNWFHTQGDNGSDVFGYDLNKNRLFVNGAIADPKSGANRQTFFCLLTCDIADRPTAPNINRIGYHQAGGGYQGDIACVKAFSNRLTEINRVAEENSITTNYTA
jgi:hypothetical protein